MRNGWVAPLLSYDTCIACDLCMREAERVGGIKQTGEKRRSGVGENPPLFPVLCGLPPTASESKWVARVDIYCLYLDSYIGTHPLWGDRHSRLVAGRVEQSIALFLYFLISKPVVYGRYSFLLLYSTEPTDPPTHHPKPHPADPWTPPHPPPTLLTTLA